MLSQKKKKMKISDEDEDYVDVRRDSLFSKWSSLAAPLLPSLLLSRDTSQLFFQSPWRSDDSIVVRVRQVALHLTNLWEADLTSQLSWLHHLKFVEDPKTPTFWLCLYSFLCIGMALTGMISLCALLRFGFLVRKLHMWGAVQTFGVLLWDFAKSSVSGRALDRDKNLKSRLQLLAASLCSFMMPPNLVACHLLFCLLTRLCEEFLRRKDELIALSQMSRDFVISETQKVARHFFASSKNEQEKCLCFDSTSL